MGLSPQKVKIFTALFMLSMLLSCTEKNDNVVYENIVSEGTIDATFAWLNEEENLPKANYMPVFYDYYKKLLDEDNLVRAAHVLEVI